METGAIRTVSLSGCRVGGVRSLQLIASKQANFGKTLESGGRQGLLREVRVHPESRSGGVCG
jgi:hypothetical protein